MNNFKINLEQVKTRMSVSNDIQQDVIVKCLDTILSSYEAEDFEGMAYPPVNYYTAWNTLLDLGLLEEIKEHKN